MEFAEKKIYGYARVSTDMQEDSLEIQIERLVGQGVAKENIISDVKSGRKYNRNGYLKLMNLVKAGKVGKLFITRYDRLGRTQQGLISALSELEKYGVELIAIDQPTEKDHMGKFVRGLFGLLGELEVDQLRSRIIKNFEQARKEGKAFRPPFGYVTSNGRYVFDKQPKYSFCLVDNKPDDPAAIVPGTSAYQIASDVIGLFFDYRSTRAALKAFNLKYPVQYYAGEGKLGFDHSGLTLWLRNPVLQGHTAYHKNNEQGLRNNTADWQVVENTHTDILLTSAQVAKINEICSENKKKLKYSPDRKKHLFSGLVTCVKCGNNCRYYTTGAKAKYKYYRCRDAETNLCSNKKMVKVADIESAVLVTVSKIVNTSPEFICETEEEISKRQQKVGIERRIQELVSEKQELESMKTKSKPILKAIADIELLIANLEAEKNIVDVDLLSYDKFKDEAEKLLKDLFSTHLADVVRGNKMLERTAVYDDEGNFSHFEPFMDIVNPEVKFTQEHEKVIRRLIKEIFIDCGRITDVVPLLAIEK